MITNVNLKHQQNGAAYVTTLLVLIFLLISAILGLTSVNNSTMQTRIVRNMQQKQASFQNAEASAGISEVEWFDAVTSCFNNLATCSLDYSPSYVSEDIHHDAFWGTKSVSAKGGVKFGDAVVEYFGTRLIPGESERKIHFYRITSRGQDKLLKENGNQDADASSTTFIQTMIRICTRSDGSGLC